MSRLFDGFLWLIGGFVGAMNPTELTAAAAGVRRWLARFSQAISRLSRVVWPDVRDPDERP